MDYKSSLMWKELNETPKILAGLREVNASALSEMRKAVQAADIGCICAAARGTSSHAMLFFRYLIECRLGIPFSVCAPSAVTIYGAKMRYENTFVIGCSQSGRAADVMEVLAAANRCGAVTAAITNDEHSPLAKSAQYHLYCNAGEEKSVAATKTFCSQLYLSLLLADAFGAKTDIREIAEFLARAMPSLDAATDGMAKDFLRAEGCFILGRGLSSSLAFECGLKLQETCYIRARAYCSSDFYHGPMAMVEEGTKIILFASKHSISSETEQAHREDYIRCAKKMEELGADLYIITDDEQSFRSMNVHVELVPGGKTEAETAFCFALAAQMLACKVSCGKGLSPDSPRALQKVTVTR